MPGACWQAVRKEQTNLANHQCEQLEDQATSCMGYRSNLHLPKSYQEPLPSWINEVWRCRSHSVWKHSPVFPWAMSGWCMLWPLGLSLSPSPWRHLISRGLPWLTLACHAPQPLWDEGGCSWVSHSIPRIHDCVIKREKRKLHHTILTVKK